MNSISIYQSSILMKMMDNDLLLVIENKENPRSWLENESGEYVESVRIDTAKILSSIGCIEPVIDKNKEKTIWNVKNRTKEVG